MKRPRYDTSCKLGTMPALVRLHRGDEVAVGRIVRVQEMPGARWMGVLVTRKDEHGYFTASLMLGDVPANCSQATLEGG